MASALITFVKADNLSRLPRWLLLPLMKWYVQKEKQTLLPNDIPMEALIPTQRFDGLLVKEMDSSLENFAGRGEGLRVQVIFLRLPVCTQRALRRSQNESASRHRGSSMWPASASTLRPNRML